MSKAVVVIVRVSGMFGIGGGLVVVVIMLHAVVVIAIATKVAVMPGVAVVSIAVVSIAVVSVATVAVVAVVCHEAASQAVAIDVTKATVSVVVVFSVVVSAVKGDVVNVAVHGFFFFPGTDHTDKCCRKCNRIHNLYCSVDSNPKLPAFKLPIQRTSQPISVYYQ